MTTSHASGASSVDGVEASALPSESELERRLTPAQLAMMSLGGAIGAGLFVGSGAAIAVAGPAVLIAYVIAGLIIIAVMHMLGEMAVREPSSGAFSVFAERALGPIVGTTVGWLYWAQLIIVIAAEALGAAGVMNGWFPVLGVGGWVIAFVALFTVLNLLNVKHYGRIEFWFAGLKVVAILAFLVLGAALLLGLVPGVPSPGFSNLVPPEGFAPTGILGIASALLIVMFAFGGTEVAAIAAAETENPKTSIQRAVRSVLWRILVFYICSILVIVLALPWNDPAVAEGPFAAVLELTNIPAVETIISIVVVVALLSALNANLYAASRMIFSLARRGNAPGFLGRVSARHVPVAAVVASVIVGFVTGVIAIFNPDEDLLVPLLNVIGSTIILLWIAITVSFIVLRRRGERRGEVLEYRLPFGYGFATIALIGLGVILVLSAFDPVVGGQLFATIALAVGIGVITSIVLLIRRSRSTK